MDNNAQANLASFADKLITEAGFDKLPENFRNDFKEQIMSEAISRLGMMVMAELPEDKLEEYGKLIGQSKDPENDPNISKFVADNIVDFSKKFFSTLAEYAQEFKAEAQKSLKK